MKNAKFNGDTKTGRRLQKNADEKRDRIQIAAYLALDLDGFTEDQIRIRIFELAEKHGKE